MADTEATNQTALVPAMEGLKATREQARERMRTILAFFLFGALIYATYSLMISAAQDVLAGTYIQTSMVLVANIGPYFVVTLIAPYFMQKISYFARISTVFMTGSVGFVMVVFSKEVVWKLIGIGVASFGYGVGEVSFLALTTYFHHITLSAYSAGTGAGFVLAPLYYTAMTTWFCVSPNVAILIMAGMFLMLFLCYYVMDKKHLAETNPDPTSRDVPYTRLKNMDDGDDHLAKTVLEGRETEAENGAKHASPGAVQLTWQEKTTIMKTMFPYLVPLFIAWLSEYLIIQAVVTTIAFKDAPFRPRDHYQYYIFVFLLGEVIGRSHRVVLSCLKPDWLFTPTFSHIWILSVIEVLHFFFFFLASWFRFIPSVGIVLFVCLTGGVAIGALFNTALAFFSETFDERHREFVMGYVAVAMGCGTFTAGLAGLYVEPVLRRHCMSVVDNSAYCITRSTAFERIISRCGAKNA